MNSSAAPMVAFNITVQLYRHAVHLAGAFPWSMRLQLQFLYPTEPE